MTVHVCGSVVPAGNVAARAWSSPPLRMKLHRVDPERRSRPPGAARRRRRPRRLRSTATPLAAATWPRSATSPSETSIIAVAPSARRLGAGGVRRLGTAVGLDQRARRAEAAAEHRQAGGGPALPTAQRDHVARARAGAAHRVAVDGADRRHRDHHLVGGGEVAADDARADQGALRGDPVGQLERPRRPAGPAARRAPTVSAVATPAHRVEVGEVGRGGPVADVVGARPSRGGSGGPSTSTSVETTTRPPGTSISAASSPGPISTWSPWGKRGDQLGDQPELAEVGQGGGQR